VAKTGADLVAAKNSCSPESQLRKHDEDAPSAEASSNRSASTWVTIRPFWVSVSGCRPCSEASEESPGSRPGIFRSSQAFDTRLSVPHMAGTLSCPARIAAVAGLIGDEKLYFVHPTGGAEDRRWY